jgi:hypothetical protein
LGCETSALINRGFALTDTLKCLRDGVNDFEYVQILKSLGQGTWALQQAATVGQDWHTWTRSPADIEAVRITLGNRIEQQLVRRSADSPHTH